MTFSKTFLSYVKLIATLTVFQAILIIKAESDTLIGLSLIFSFFFLLAYIGRKPRS